MHPSSAVAVDSESRHNDQELELMATDSGVGSSLSMHPQTLELQKTWERERRALTLPRSQEEEPTMEALRRKS